MKGAGPSTAAIAVAGYYTTVNPQAVAFVETYDGSSWTEVGDVNTARWNIGTAGTQTATLAAAGEISGDPATTSDTEEFNGISWTEVTNLDTDRGGGAGCGPKLLLYLSVELLIPQFQYWLKNMMELIGQKLQI